MNKLQLAKLERPLREGQTWVPAHPGRGTQNGGQGAPLDEVTQLG